ncbi:hypothetical protein D3C76_1847510 [compost metagenome]
MNGSLIFPWVLKEYILTLELSQATTVLDIRIGSSTDRTNRDLGLGLNDGKPSWTLAPVR